MNNKLPKKIIEQIRKLVPIYKKNKEPELLDIIDGLLIMLEEALTEDQQPMVPITGPIDLSRTTPPRMSPAVTLYAVAVEPYDHLDYTTSTTITFTADESKDVIVTTTPKAEPKKENNKPDVTAYGCWTATELLV